MLGCEARPVKRQQPGLGRARRCGTSLRGVNDPQSGPSGAELRFVVGFPEQGRTLGAALRSKLPELAWSQVRRLCERGKVRVDGELALDAAVRLQARMQVEVNPAAKLVRRGGLLQDAIVYVDAELLVVNKPAFLLTVPFEPEDADTLLDRAQVWQRHSQRAQKAGPSSELGVVQRLDKETTGVLVFARTLSAKRALQQQFRAHSIERRYLAVAHGVVPAFRSQTHLLQDRGDRYRGSWELTRGARLAEAQPPREARVAVTECRPLQALRGATLIECRLHTGRQHQIRIHLSERGHPLLGEQVYIRDYAGTPLPAERVLLHAAVLGFEHPRDGRPMRFECPAPADFQAALAALGPVVPR